MLGIAYSERVKVFLGAIGNRLENTQFSAWNQHRAVFRALPVAKRIRQVGRC